MIVPKICRNGGTEYARRIHCRAGKRSSEQDVERDRCSDHQPRDAPRPAFIHGCAMNHEHEKERENSFDQNSLPRGKVDSKLWSTINNDIAPEQTETNQGSTDSAETLCNPEAKSVAPF